MPMVMINKPKLFDSEWVYVKPQGGYALKKGVPKEAKKEFSEFKKALKSK